MFYFILGLIIGAGVVWMWKRRDSIAPIASGLQNDNPNQEAMEKKGKNLEKVMAMAREKGAVRNDEIQYALGISDATAARYLEELKSEGKLEQVGYKKGVIYRVK